MNNKTAAVNYNQLTNSQENNTRINNPERKKAVITNVQLLEASSESPRSWRQA